jgi:hypothetical protein
MTPIAQPPKITELTFDVGFTGDAKIFVKVETAGSGSEKLVIYEKSGIAAFFTDIFRNRRNTLTLREWAGNAQDCLPQTLDKERLTQNIKQIKQAMLVQAPQMANETPLGLKMINQLLAEKKLDVEVTIFSDDIKNAQHPLMAGEILKQFKPSLEAILKSLGLDDSEVGLVMKGKGAEVDSKKIAAAKSMLKANNGVSLEHAFDQLIQQASDRWSLEIKAMCLADFVHDKGDVTKLMALKPSDAKSLAKCLLALDKTPADFTVQHQRYINTLKLAIQQLEKIEQEKAAATPQT